MSGARYYRPGLAALLDYIREGDTVVVWKLDRLGRNTLHILETVKASSTGVSLWCRREFMHWPSSSRPATQEGMTGRLYSEQVVLG